MLFFLLGQDFQLWHFFCKKMGKNLLKMHIKLLKQNTDIEPSPAPAPASIHHVTGDGGASILELGPTRCVKWFFLSVTKTFQNILSFSNIWWWFHGDPALNKYAESNKLRSILFRHHTKPDITKNYGHYLSYATSANCLPNWFLSYHSYCAGIFVAELSLDASLVQTFQMLFFLLGQDFQLWHFFARKWAKTY